MLNNFLLLPCWVNWLIVLFVLGGLITAFLLIFPVKIWLRTATSKCQISLWKLYAMKLRKTKLDLVVEAYINCKKSGIDLTYEEIEAHHVSGGDVLKLSDGLIMAKNAKIPLRIDIAKAIDLSGRDLCETIKATISPKIIETEMVCAIAKDGFEVKAKARITALALIDKLIGGADEKTISARVGEALMTEIGKAFQYTDFMHNPEVASKNLMAKGLDNNTAFKIVSINISDMSLGKNIEAQTLLEEAEIDKQIAQAKAEERKANAQANEQEAKAKTQEAKINLVHAECEVPKAIAQAFEEGKISVEDYYRIENIIADTNLRKKLADSDKKGF